MTFAGLITAGVAVALQSIILSMVGYFFLIGRYGIRPGDMIQVGEVVGQVIDIGMVRMHLMEFGRDGAGPTGRVVALSNSTVFQASGGVIKQLPGLHFAWHDITLALATDTDAGTVRERLLQAVTGALTRFQDVLEPQNREIARNAVALGRDAAAQCQLSGSHRRHRYGNSLSHRQAAVRGHRRGGVAGAAPGTGARTGDQADSGLSRR